jgi:hypothetical protein
MNIGNASALESASRAHSRRYRKIVGVATVSTIALALTVSVIAQGLQTPRNTREAEGQGQPSLARLVIPITGTVATATPTPPTAPPTEPPTSPTEPPALPTEPPAPPTEPPTPPTEPTPPPTEPPATPAEPPLTPTVPGQIDGALTPDVTGTFSIRRFARTTNDAVAAVGTLTLSLTDPASNAVRTVVTELALPIARAGDPDAPGAPPAQPSPIGPTPQALAAEASACETLSLVLGPLQFDVLGTAVQLNEANVDVIAVPGASERFKNRLCGLTALMEGAAPRAEVVRMLNRLLDTLG